jgi:hypothetical protein
MDRIMCPWDAIELLEAQVRKPAFPERWRRFVRACSEAIVDQLPAEARTWLDAAAAYDRGEKTEAELAALSAAAWQLHLSRQKTDPWSVQRGLVVVMTTLGTGINRSRWYEGAWHFLHACSAAGLSDGQLRVFLKDAFGLQLAEMERKMNGSNTD